MNALDVDLATSRWEPDVFAQVGCFTVSYDAEYGLFELTTTSRGGERWLRALGAAKVTLAVHPDHPFRHECPLRTGPHRKCQTAGSFWRLPDTTRLDLNRKLRTWLDGHADPHFYV
jgi:hypothetical protein